jgi:FG-GAP-like repeat/Reeler domain
MRSNSRRSTFLKTIVLATAVLIGGFGVVNISYDSRKASASASGPSPSHTDAPGEDNCTACHVQFPVNSGTGSVQIAGVPTTYLPGQQVSLTITTSQSDGVIYGFQLTALDSTGHPAGTFTLVPTMPQQTQVVNGLVSGITRHYVEHTIDGILPTIFGSKSWNVTWTAPTPPVGKVSFYGAGNAANSDGTTSGDYIYTTLKESASPRPIFDFDGDGKTDLSIFRPGPGEWWYLKSSSGGNAAAQFGAGTDRIVPGDFTGDGKTDIAFWRPSTGQWFVLRSEDQSFFGFPFGTSTDIPAPADYDGDGKMDAAVFRPSTVTWFINKSTGGTTIQQFGAVGDVPVAADYDGDGKADIAIYRPTLGQWWIQRSTTGVTAAFQFGTSTDKPVQGDYTGDGKADVAFWRPSTGEWFILRSENGSFFSFPFGTSTDVPSPGDYDGDGKLDQAVFRPSTSTWFINRSTAGSLIVGFGQSGDRSVPNAFVP